MTRLTLISAIVLVTFQLTSASWAARYCTSTTKQKWTENNSHPQADCKCKSGVMQGIYHHRANSLTATSKAVARRQCIRAAVKVLKAKCLHPREARLIVSWSHKEVGCKTKWKGGIKYRGWCKIKYTCRWKQEKQTGYIYKKFGRQKATYNGKKERKSHGTMGKKPICRNTKGDAVIWAKKKFGRNYISIKYTKVSRKRVGLYARCTVSFQVTYYKPSKVEKRKRFRCFGK